MTLCQNDNCKAEIKRESALFCPYCGEYQSITGWHYHHQPMNMEIGKSLTHDIKFSRPCVFKLNETIKDCLVEGNILVVLGHDKAAAYDLETSVNTRRPQEKWQGRLPVGEEAKAVILRPYLIIIENHRIRGVHLESEEEFDFLIFSKNPDCLPFKDSKIIIPFEIIMGNKREAVLILGVEKSLLFLVFGENNQVSRHILKTIDFKSHILSINVEDPDNHLIHVFSVLGEYTKIDLGQCLQEQKPYYRSIPCNKEVFPSEERPTGGFSVEWAFTRKDTTIFLIRKNTGESILFKTTDKGTEMITGKVFSKKNPSVGKNQPLILFESIEFKNQLVGYHWLDGFLREYSLPTSKCFNIEIDKFEILPERILYFAGKYWAICPCNNPLIPFQLVSMEFDASGSINVNPELNITNVNRDSFKVLPLILNRRQLLSYTEKTIIVLS